MNNSILNTLLSLKIVEQSFILDFFPRTRDNEFVSVMKCNKSGVIFLNSDKHIDNLYYEEKENLSYWQKDSFDAIKEDNYSDDSRRSKYINVYIRNKIWADIGCGVGGILDINKNIAKNIFAVEPQKYCQEILRKRDFVTMSKAEELPSNFFDLITMFHVFEHLTNPIEMLTVIYEKLKLNSHLIIEVPHARDALISWYDLDDFKKFTFWSEHLILHTRESLKIMLESVGFEVLSIEGVQRYPLSNHLYWLSKKQPDGHFHWSQLSNEILNHEYENILAKLDITDTLILVAKKL